MTTTSQHKKEGLADKALRALSYATPFAVTAVLVWWVFRKVDFADMMRTIREGCDYTFLVLMMLINTLSHVLRGIRWGIQLRDVGLPRVPAMVESVSIFGAYAMNLLFPWLGEGWRCVYMSRRLGAPISTVVGTDIGDRTSDAIVIVLLGLFTLLVARGPLSEFMTHYQVGRDIAHVFANKWLWLCVALGAAICGVFHHFFRNYMLVKKFDASLENVWKGFAVLFHLKQFGRYLLLTLGIWVCYFVMNYVCFFAFPFTRALVEQPGTCWGLVPGLVVFVFGSFSIGIPSNGGLGPWNIAVMFALSLYGIGNAEGAAFSMMVWGCQNLMIILMGIFAAIYITMHRRKGQPGGGAQP